MSKCFDVIMFSNNQSMIIVAILLVVATVLFCFVVLDVKSKQPAGKSSLTVIEDNLYLKLNLVLMTRILIAVVINILADYSFVSVVPDDQTQRVVSIVLLSYYCFLLMITFIQAELKSDIFSMLVHAAELLLYFPLTMLGLFVSSFSDTVPHSDYSIIKNAIRCLSDEVILESFYVPETAQNVQTHVPTVVHHGRGKEIELETGSTTVSVSDL